jgi:hypothetical protein
MDMGTAWRSNSFALLFSNFSYDIFIEIRARLRYSRLPNKSRNTYTLEQ